MLDFHYPKLICVFLYRNLAPKPVSIAFKSYPSFSMSTAVILSPNLCCLSLSVQFSHSVVSDSLRPHGLHHTRLPCLTPTTGVYSNSCPLSRWRHITISSSVIPFPCCLQCFPASGSFQMSQFFASGGQSTGASASASGPSSEYSGLIFFRIDWFDLIVQGILKSLLQYHSSKASVLRHSAFFTVQLSHPYMTTRKTIALTRWTVVGKVMSLLFNMLSRLVMAFLLRNKHLLISWMQSPSVVFWSPPN